MRGLYAAIADDNYRTKLIERLHKYDYHKLYTRSETSRMDVTQLKRAIDRVFEHNNNMKGRK